MKRLGYGPRGRGGEGWGSRRARRQSADIRRQTSDWCSRAGVTLLELIVCVAVLGLTASVATLAVRSAVPPDPNDPMTIIADTLETVLGTGTPATLQFTINGRPALATLNADGSIVADSILGIDRLTGRRTRAP